jgi:ribosomal protein L11 methyltransferase|tara:strand:- start:8877 stop:9740 length:864 start_codon:yes stop_codon:yes gene_type:complete
VYWKKITVGATKDTYDALEILLWDLGAVSVTVTDASDNPIFEPPPGETPLWSDIDVCGLFEQDLDHEQLESQIKDLGFRVLFSEDLGDRPWEREWLSEFGPMQFGRRLWVVPDGLAVEDPNAVVVDLDPGLAFGTGTHATTRLCLEWLDSQVLEGKRVIDYGSGSGILGIAALRLGADEVWAVDNDPQALDSTRNNAMKNRVEERLRVCSPDGLDIDDADIVIANILAQPLIELAGLLVSLLKENGDLLLSGILVSQESWVESAYVEQVSFVQRRNDDGWSCLQARK